MSERSRETLPVRGKLANGLYCDEMVLSAESVVVHLYAARPFEPSELAAYAFADDVGTPYTQALPLEPVEGRFTIAFAPGPPAGWRSLSLSRPGHLLVVARSED